MSNGQDAVLIESKHAVQSTSAWGALTLAVPLIIKIVGPIFGVEFSEADAKQFEAAVGASQQAYLNVMMVIGAIQLAIGRINARQPLHFTPGARFYIDAATGRRVPMLTTVPADVAVEMQARPAPATPVA